MLCHHCKKKYVHPKGASPNICSECLETGLTFYKLGLQDAERRLKQTINALRASNKALWDEITEHLDVVFPLDGTYVRVPIPVMKKIIHAKQTNFRHWCKKLKKLMYEQVGNLPDIVDKVVDGRGKR